MHAAAGPSNMSRLIHVLIVAALAAPFAAASDHGEAGPDEHVVVLADAATPNGRFYVVEDHGAVSLWRESNGVEDGGVARMTGGASGVQTEWFCLQDDGAVVYVLPDEGCETGVLTPPDTRLTNSALLHEVDEAVHEVEHAVEDLLP